MSGEARDVATYSGNLGVKVAEVIVATELDVLGLLVGVVELRTRSVGVGCFYGCFLLESRPGEVETWRDEGGWVSTFYPWIIWWNDIMYGSCP